MFDQGRSLESAVRSSESYSAPLPPINVAISPADMPPKLSTDPATLADLGFQEQSASSVETTDNLVPSALNVMLHALTAVKRGTFKGFVMEGEQSSSSVETTDILVPSALHVMLHALTAVKRSTFKGFVVEGLLLCLQELWLLRAT